MSSIHTVTTIAHHPDNPSLRRFPSLRSFPRCWGYHLTREEARIGMQQSCDDEAGYYNYAVIERYQPGMYAIAEDAEWYEYNHAKREWTAIEEPEFARQTINFAIG